MCLVVKKLQENAGKARNVPKFFTLKPTTRYIRFEISK